MSDENENDKFLNKKNPFESLEFEAQIDNAKIPDYQKAMIEEELKEPEKHEAPQQQTSKATTTDRGLDSQQEWSNAFNDMLLEVFDNENAFQDIQKNFTKILLDKGIQVSPQDVYKLVEMANTRMIKLSLAKSLAHAHGLHYEWPRILEKELALLYNGRQISSNTIVGPSAGEVP